MDAGTFLMLMQGVAAAAGAANSFGFIGGDDAPQQALPALPTGPQGPAADIESGFSAQNLGQGVQFSGGAADLSPVQRASNTATAYGSGSGGINLPYSSDPSGPNNLAQFNNDLLEMFQSGSSIPPAQSNLFAKYIQGATGGNVRDPGSTTSNLSALDRYFSNLAA